MKRPNKDEIREAVIRAFRNRGAENVSPSDRTVMVLVDTLDAFWIEILEDATCSITGPITVTVTEPSDPDTLEKIARLKETSGLGIVLHEIDPGGPVMRVDFLDADLNEAIVRRRAWWPFGRWLEAVVRCHGGVWEFANGDLVRTPFRRVIEAERDRIIHARPWRPARTRVAPAELVASRVDINSGALVRKR